ncbi:MAG: HAD family hydrolase [Desulfobacteraceae bacterium]|nr:HAD family hydrolase [Desulfobacteraceae bacterium]
MSRFRGVIFDLDGTLLDTLLDLANSMNAALRGLGFAPHPVDGYRTMVGEGSEVLARRALPPASRDEATVARCVAAFLAEYSRRWNEHTRPYPGIPELLDILSDRRIRMTILSNKKQELTELTVARLLPSWRFDAVAGARPDVPKKPDPTAALRLAAELRLSPGEILYLGDTNTDMQTATGAGMHPVGALWGFRTEEELRTSGARAVVAHPRDLAVFFEGKKEGKGAPPRSR